MKNSLSQRPARSSRSPEVLFHLSIDLTTNLLDLCNILIPTQRSILTGLATKVPFTPPSSETSYTWKDYREIRISLLMKLSIVLSCVDWSTCTSR